MTELVLAGCRPEPLGSYLKSLGVIRLVAQQKDPKVQAWWQNDALVLRTKLGREQLLDFFLREYRPTPIVAPWNGGSGFYEGDTVSGRDAILAAESERFQGYRETIEAILGWQEMPPTGLTLGRLMERLRSAADQFRGKKAEDLRAMLAATEQALAGKRDLLTYVPEDLPKGELKKLATKARTQVKQLSRSAGKERLVELCRARLGEQAVEWLDCVVMLTADGDAQYPPLLGTGANDGRLDYTNTQMQRLAELLLPQPGETSGQLLMGSLFGAPVNGLQPAPIGQFDPGRAGGFNQGFGIKADTPLNAWDYVLIMEGAPVWSCNIVRRHETGRPGNLLSSPFTVLARSVGYGSAVAQERGRAEVWAPLWERPLGYSELHAFLSEGRAEVGRRRVGNGLEFAQAVSSLGVDRGIKEFVRYSFLERRGKSYIGLPTGRLLVSQRSEADFSRELEGRLRGVDAWLRSFKPEPPQSLAASRWAIDEAIFEMLQNPTKGRCQDVFRAIGRFERLISLRDPARLPHEPPGRLRPQWISDLADDDSLEVRLAAALASVRGGPAVGPLRCNWAPIDPAAPSRWCPSGNRQAWQGNSLEQRLASALRRRLQDWNANRDSGRAGHPVSAALPVHAEEAAAFLLGGLDSDKMEELLMAFSWVDWSDKDGLSHLRSRWRTFANRAPLPRPWCLLKLLFWPGRLEGADRELVPDATVLSLLRAGRMSDACGVARRKLRAAGLNAYLIDPELPDSASRLAASLLIPVRNPEPLLARVLYPKKEEN